MTYKFGVFILLILLSFSAIAQNFLVLEKMGTKKRFEFHQGEQVELKLDTDDFYSRINIIGLQDSLIKTENHNITLSSIRGVQLQGKSSFLRYSGPILVMSGVLLFAMDAINQTLVQNGEYTYSAGVTVASLSLIGLGTAFTLAGRNKIKVRKWWRLRIVQI